MERTHVRSGRAGNLKEAHMNDEKFNQSIRKFLKTVGVNSQLEIEKAVHKAQANNRPLSGRLPASMTLRIDGLEIDLQFDADLELD